MKLKLSQYPMLVLPRFLTGLTLRDWVRLLNRHGWKVDPVFWPRALLATAGTLVTSALKVVEDTCFSHQSEQPDVWQQPIFILGLPRSGTTHLCYMLSQDSRFCFPTRFDVFNPHTLLTLRRLGVHRLLGLVPARTRGMDGVRVGWLSPEEDDLAICVLAGDGIRMNFVFPRHERVEKHPPGVFQQALASFTRKLVQVHGRPVLLKSPSHTDRIPEILEVFPQARFITIFRRPEAVLASWYAMHHAPGGPVWCALQWPPDISRETLMQRMGKRLETYFRDRSLIPPANLVEIRHEDLLANPVETLTRVYSCLDLELPVAVLKHSGRPYRGNRHPDIVPEDQLQLRALCIQLYTGGWYTDEEN